MEALNFGEWDYKGDLCRVRGLIRRLAKIHRRETGASITASVRVAERYVMHEWSRRFGLRVRRAIAVARMLAAEQGGAVSQAKR